MPSGEQDTVAIILPPDNVDPHGTLRSTAGTYRSGFEAVGFSTVTVDLNHVTLDDIRTLQSPRIKLIFSDGGWINTVFADTGTGRPRLVEVLEKPVLVLLNDNPCSHWMEPILKGDRKGQITAVLDPDFFTIWERWAEPQGPRQLYVPACPAMAPPTCERPLGTLVVASVQDPDHYRDFIMSKSEDRLMARMFDGIAETLLADPLRSLSTACDEVLRNLNVRLNYNSAGVRIFLFAVDYHVRNRRRHAMLARLSRHPITLVGGGKGIDLHPDSTVIPPVSHSRLLEFYGHAETVVVSPPYPGGISERIIQSLGAGALVVSPPTALSDRLLGRDRLFVTCAADFSDLGDGLERAADPRLRREMVGEAQPVATRDFSPTATVRRFLGEAEALSF